MKTCVFAGTFDPFSKGHEYVVNKCLETFDRVVIAIGVNVDKTPMFTLNERIEIIKSIYDDERVEVTSFSGMLTAFMKEKNIKFNVRGIRNEDDYKYENTMAKYNADMYPEMVSVFIPTPNDLVYVSSTAIRNILELEANAEKYLPEKAVETVDKIIKAKKKR